MAAPQTAESRPRGRELSALRPLCLFGVLVLARLLGRGGEGLMAPASLLSQLAHDAAAAAALWPLDLILCRSGMRWGLYGALCAAIAVNVAVQRSLGAPLSWPMLRAARGALWDSIAHHATAANFGAIALTLAAAALLPRLARKLPPRAPRLVGLGAAALIGLAPIAGRWSERPELDRNLLSALALSALPRVPAAPPARASTVDWRRSPMIESGGTEPPFDADLAALAGAARGRNVVLVLLESCGASYLGLHGANPDPMPRLSELARDALVVDDAACVYPESIKSLLATFCSRYPAIDTDAKAYAAIRPPSLPEELRRAGYATALFHSGRFAYLGMRALIEGRGFERLEDAGDIGGERESSFGVGEEATVRRMVEWIDSEARARPFFLTYLPIAGHHPYASPEAGPFPEEKELGLYLNALHYGDRCLGEFFDGLSQRGLMENTLFVLFGDHGEAFGQHEGNFAHTLAIYEENLRVPWVIAAPGLITAQRRIPGPASTIDSAPTILDLLGLEIPVGFEGRSLLRPPTARVSLFFTDYSLGLLGLRDGRWKCIHELESSRTRLFDLAADPAEREDLSRREPARAAAYAEHLRAWCTAQRQTLSVR